MSKNEEISAFEKLMLESMSGSALRNVRLNSLKITFNFEAIDNLINGISIFSSNEFKRISDELKKQEK